MLKYNLKSFFKENILQNKELCSNGYFIIKKSILTKSQIKTIEKLSWDDKRIKGLEDILKTEKEKFNINTKKEFIPDTISHDLKVLYDSKNKVALDHKYYSFFKDKGCIIYKGRKSLAPLILYKNNEFVGILMPMNPGNGIQGKKYSEYMEKYTTEQEKKKKEKDRLNKLKKKCLYISNNKAVTRNKPLKCVADITGIEKYSNLYVDVKPFDVTSYDKGSVELFIDLGIICMSLNRILRVDTLLDDVEHNFSGYEHITLEWYTNYLEESLGSDRWVTVAELKLMELAGRTKMVEDIKKHRIHVKEIREQEERERTALKEKKNQDFVEQENKIAEDIIAKAEQAILKNEKIVNEDIEIFKNRYESKTMSLILHLMKKYDVKVPLRTQGWINKALNSIYYSKDSEEYGYCYYSSSSNSTVFSEYLKELISKIKEEHGVSA